MSTLPAELVLTSSRQVIFEVPDGKRARVDSIRVVNETGTDATVNIYVNASGQARRMEQRDLLIPAGGLGLDDEVKWMTSGNKVEGDGSAALVVTIFGEVLA